MRIKWFVPLSLITVFFLISSSAYADLKWQKWEDRPKPVMVLSEPAEKEPENVRPAQIPSPEALPKRPANAPALPDPDEEEVEELDLNAPSPAPAASAAPEAENIPEEQAVPAAEEEPASVREAEISVGDEPDTTDGTDWLDESKDEEAPAPVALVDTDVPSAAEDAAEISGDEEEPEAEPAPAAASDEQIKKANELLKQKFGN